MLQKLLSLIGFTSLLYPNRSRPCHIAFNFEADMRFFYDTGEVIGVEAWILRDPRYVN